MSIQRKNRHNQKMYKEASYPTFDICNLNTTRLSNDLFNVDRFRGYVKNNPHVQNVHKHSFYHLVFFTAGEGQQILDFETYPIKKGIIYFMRPNQTHKWFFEGEADGYVVNFSADFFEQLAIRAEVLDNFPFFNLFSSHQVLELDKISREKVGLLFEEIIREVQLIDEKSQGLLMIATYLLQIFTISGRNIHREDNHQEENYFNSTVIKKFLELIEDNFRAIRLPKDYASMLYISSSHLNMICQEQLNTSAGELIRNRVLLEAKRLLINFELSVSAIALDLNFFDTSYFVKFFKKETGLTPDAFRKQYNNKPSPTIH